MADTSLVTVVIEKGWGRVRSNPPREDFRVRRSSVRDEARLQSPWTMRRLLVCIAAIVVTLLLACIALFVLFKLWFGVAWIEGSTISTESVTVVPITPQP